MSNNTSNTSNDFTESPPSTIEFIDGELFVFGKQIRAHSEMPWLFCATDLHKACEFFIKRAATRKGEDPEVKFVSKRPANWIQYNLNDGDSIADIAEITRKRIKERGAYLGLKPISKKSNASTLALLDTLSDKELILYSRKGNSPTSGTYLSLHALVQYASFMNKSLHTKIIQSYMDIITGDVERVTEAVVSAKIKAKGTPTRDLNVVFIKQFQEVCLRKGLNSRILMGDVNQLVFGMSKKEFMDKYGVDEPFNDNVPVHFIALKNMLLSSVTGSLMACPQTVLNNAAAKLLISKMAKPLLKAVSQEALNERQEKLFASSTWARLVCTPN